MTAESVTAPERESLIALEEALDQMMARLLAIVDAPPLTEQGLIEITAIYNNVAYIFLYLEANEEHVRYERLLTRRDAFHQSPELDARILSLLLGLQCTDPEAEDSRLAYIGQLRDKAQSLDAKYDDQVVQLLGEAKAVIAEVTVSQSQLLERLRAPVGGPNPSAVFYRMASSTASAATRSKLGRVWTAQRDRRRDDLIALVDRMVQVRRDSARAAGFDTVLDRTLAKCNVAEAEVEEFVGHYLEQALVSFERLAEQVRIEVGDGADGDPMDHFGFYLQHIIGGTKLPLFRLDECLDFVFAVAASVFGVRLELLPTDHTHIVRYRVCSDEHEIGLINFDLWDTAGKASGANHTRGLRNRTDWSGLVQTPIAYVSCRFQRGADATERITFQNVHSLFHEFGHAVNHLLIRRRISNQSGLEYLPLERLEYLSMWFEKWVYHPRFATSLSLPKDGVAGVQTCQRLKALEYQRTYVERAVTAALDFHLHRQINGGLAEAFAELDAQLGLSRYCALGDFPVYFTWPMFQANPGANFGYLWGASDSVQKFLVFEPLSLDEVAHRYDLLDLFGPSFDFAHPAPAPASEPMFAFYDRLASEEPTTPVDAVLAP